MNTQLTNYYKNTIMNFNNVLPMFSEKEYKGTQIGYKSIIYKWKCKSCGNEFKSRISFGKKPKCQCEYKLSKIGGGRTARDRYYEETIMHFDNIEPLFTIEEYKGSKYNYKWKCTLCNNIFTSRLDSAHIPKCHCTDINKLSKRESKVLEIFENEKDYEFLSFGSKNTKESVIYNHISCGTKNETNIQHFLSGQRCGNKTCKYNKAKQTVINKYGVDNISKSPEVQKKKETTCIEHYGVNNPYKSKEVQEKIKDTMMEKYGVKHNIFMRKQVFNTSKIERDIQNYVESLIPIERNKRIFNNGMCKEIDIYIPSKKIALELNGLYWHSESSGEKDRRYHIEKLNFINNEGIKLFQFYDYEWTNKKELVQSMIKSKLGLSDTKIMARKCFIKEIDSKDEKIFLENNHIQGGVQSSKRYGLYYNEELVALLTLGKPRYNKDYDWEILRYCNKINSNVIGGFSRLLSHFIKEIKPKNILTYADRRYSDGGVYEKNGFKYLHDSSPNYYYFKDDSRLYHRSTFQKHKLAKLLESFNPNLTEWENMQANGYDRIWDCGNLVFSYTNRL
jgi:hypothetical protein